MANDFRDMGYRENYILGIMDKRISFRDNERQVR